MKTKLFLTVLFAGIYFAGSAQWTTQANVPIMAGQESSVTHPNGNVYVFGGYSALSNESDSLFIFNQSGNSWSVGALIPNPTRGAASALGNDSLIYCISGYYNSDYTDSCYSYNTKTNAWKSITPIPTPVWYAAAATAPSGKIYVFGGENNTGNYDLVQIYNPVNNTWSSGTPLPAAVLGEAAVTAKNGKIYVIGGMGNTNVIDSVQIYDPVADTWSRGALMPTARHEFAYGIDQNNIIYCIGGKTAYGNNTEPYLNVVERYDAYTDTWVSDGPILPHGLGETTGAFVNNGINVFGGTDSANGYDNWNYRLDIAPTLVLPISAGTRFNVYPNPSTGNVTIAMDGSGQDVNIHITDMAGQTCYTQTWNNVTNGAAKQIDLSGLSKGIYFVQCISGNNTTVKKLILQ